MSDPIEDLPDEFTVIDYDANTCGCLAKIRARIEERHGDGYAMHLKEFINIEEGKRFVGLAPLTFEFKDGRKWRKSHVPFRFCPFCGASYDASDEGNKGKEGQ